MAQRGLGQAWPPAIPELVREEPSRSSDVAMRG